MYQGSLLWVPPCNEPLDKIYVVSRRVEMIEGGRARAHPHPLKYVAVSPPVASSLILRFRQEAAALNLKHPLLIFKRQSGSLVTASTNLVLPPAKGVPQPYIPENSLYADMTLPIASMPGAQIPPW